MWIRSRLDIGWRDLFVGLAHCGDFRSRRTALARVNAAWGSHTNVLITLSLRSSFDLLLRALNLPAGSEVLLSAITVPGMIAIVRHHQLVPVPIDVDEQGCLCLNSLRSAVSKKSKVLVVAQLWGNRMPLEQIRQVADEHGILLVEDCAQSFSGLQQSRNSESDVEMYSFGPIKTATALGGGLTIVRSDQLYASMMKHLERDPTQPRWQYAKRIARFTVLKLLSNRSVAQLFFALLRRRGLDPDHVLSGLGAGFSPQNLVDQIRHQPSTPLLRLMCRRLRTYDFSRIDRRRQVGQQLSCLLSVPNHDSNTFWAFPLVQFRNGHRNKSEIIASARANGFDATAKTRMTLVPPVDERSSPVASRWWSDVVFLPCYPDLSSESVERLANSVLCRKGQESPTDCSA